MMPSLFGRTSRKEMAAIANQAERTTAANQAASQATAAANQAIIMQAVCDAGHHRDRIAADDDAMRVSVNAVPSLRGHLPVNLLFLSSQDQAKRKFAPSLNAFLSKIPLLLVFLP